MVITIFGAAITLVAVLVAAWFLGGYMVRVFTGERVFMTPVVRPVERVFYRLMDVREDQEQSWIFYLVAMMLVQVISFLLTYVVLRLQHGLPLNPQHLPRSSTARRSRQRPSLHDEHQLAVVCRGDDDVVLLADDAAGVPQLRVGGRRHRAAPSPSSRWHRAAGREADSATSTVDLVRGTLYVLLPLAVSPRPPVRAAGRDPELPSYPSHTTLEGVKQTLAMGPVASQEAIKQLGTNGGGFFNANSAHPFENPTPWTNFLQMVAIFLIPGARLHASGAW